MGPEKGTDAKETKPTGVHFRGLVVGPCVESSDTEHEMGLQAPLEAKSLQASEIGLEDATEVYQVMLLLS